jgi:hypothetical protein
MTAPARTLTMTIDPTQIQDPSQIPPPGSQFTGQSAQGLVDVYSGTLSGDLDAQPSAKELLGAAPDTGGLTNADYIYKQVSALYGSVDLPGFQSPSGNNVKSIVFVSGSTQGGYGAFHLESGSQADFDRIVVDSLNSSGSYSAGSGLGASIVPAHIKVPHLFPKFRGAADLLEVVHSGDPKLKTAKPAAIQEALMMAAQSTLALKMAIERRDRSAVPPKASLDGKPKHGHAEPARQLVQANQELLGLVAAATNAAGGRLYLSTALFAAEIIESFQLLTGKADAGRTDGEAVSRVLAFKLAPEIMLIPGFNSAITQQWWKDGHPDFVNDNSQNDQSTDGNAAGVMFLEFLTDFLGVPVDQIIQHMPATGAGGAPLGQTYVALLKDFPQLVSVAGNTGVSAFQKMISLLRQNTQNPDGSLNLPADGNPFPSMPSSKQGGLFAGKTSNPGSLAQDAQAALGLQSQLDQQFASLKATLQQIQADVSARPAPPALTARDRWWAAVGTGSAAALGYRPPLPASIVASLDRRVAPFRAPQYDQTLQDEFWKHVYNELPGTGPSTNRLQVITGTNQAPVAVQITGTITETKHEPDGDLHISFQPDDPNFPTNQGAGAGEAPLEVEIIYAGPVTQPDAKVAKGSYKNPFDISHLGSGTRIQAAGPLIFDRAHGKPASDGKNVEIGLEIHPLVGMTMLSRNSRPTPSVNPPVSPTPPSPSGQTSADLASAQGQADTLGQTLGSLSALLQKMKGEAPTR